MAAYNTIGRILATERIALQQARTSLDNVEQRLAKLRAEVAKLEPEADALNAHIIVAASACQSLLSRFLREFFGAGPDDVLLLIFQEVIAAHDVWKIGSVYYDHERAKAPFSLAAVCRRWRQLVRSTSALWTYFGLPKFADTTPAHLDRIVLLTWLSQQSSIDVVVDWSSHVVDVDDAPHRLQILNAIGSLAARFRRVEWAAAHESYGAALEGLHGSTSQLTRLCVRSLTTRDTPQSVGSSALSYLPHAPRLQQFTWDGDNSIWAFAASSYESLTVLTIWGDPPLRGVCDVLCIVRNVLEELNLGTELNNNATFSQDMRIELPCLVRLHLFDWRWTQHLCTPILNQLATCGVGLAAHNHPSDARCSLSMVKELILTDLVTEAGLDQLARLDNITQLTLGDSWYKEGTLERARLPLSFLSNAITRDPPLWPRLKHMHFECDIIKFQTVHAADLVAFLRSRNIISTTSQGDIEVSRIESVVLEYEAPEWLQHEVERLLAG